MVSLVGSSFFFVDGLYGQKIAAALGEFKPKVEAKEFFSADLVPLFQSQGENIGSVLKKSFEVVLALKVPSELVGFFLLKSEETGASSGTQNQGGEKEKVALVSLEEVNLTRYVVHIKGVQGPFFLHFNQPFHPNWTASTGGKTNPYHFPAEYTTLKLCHYSISNPNSSGLFKRTPMKWENLSKSSKSF
ncbi:hypothetical protein HKBW3C_01683 [Candidatus Hakubella thermalkaliphila]|nr:hypothetical protein HKBW3C_01683 [Candidatus Hakubella thermalkaliphila]